MNCHTLMGINRINELLIIHIAYICDSEIYRLFQGYALPKATKSNLTELLTEQLKATGYKL